MLEFAPAVAESPRHREAALQVADLALEVSHVARVLAGYAKAPVDRARLKAAAELLLRAVRELLEAPRE